MTRVEAEVELVGRLRSILQRFGLSTVMDGTNADLNSPMRRALADLKIPAAGTTVTDADLDKIPADKVEQFYLCCEFYVVDTVLSNAVTMATTLRLGPRQESNKDLLTGLNNRWAYLRGKKDPSTPGTPGGGVSINNKIRSQGAAHVWGVWHPVSTRKTASTTTPTPTPGQGPFTKRPIVIDVDQRQHPFRCDYGQYIVLDTTVQPVGIILPPITDNDDGKQVRVMLGKQGMDASGNTKFNGIIAVSTGDKMIGLVSSTYIIDEVGFQIPNAGESVYFTADADNKQWLVNHFQQGAGSGGPNVNVNPGTAVDARIISFDCDTRPDVAERVVHNWNTRDIEIQSYDRPTGEEVTLDIRRELNAVTITSALAGQYRVIIIGPDSGTQTRIQRIMTTSISTRAETAERIEHNWGTRDVEVQVYDEITGGQVTLDVTRELDAVTVVSSMNGVYRIVIEETQQLT